MKIDTIQPTISMQGNLKKNISRKFALAGMFLSEVGYLAKDIFIPRKKVYVEIDGKKIDERDLPNSVSYNGIIFSNGRKFFQSDFVKHTQPSKLLNVNIVNKIEHFMYLLL